MIDRHRLPLGLFGFVGSFAPSIIKMFNDLPNIAFVFKWEWGVVIVLYGLLGALVAVTYPYKKRPTAWGALLLGCSFPTALGVAASFFRGPRFGAPLGGPAEETQWDLWDFLALF
jgi:hypothetical protein